MHQYAKGEPNQFTDGTVIGTDVHTHSPPTQTVFLPQIYAFSTCIFISIYIYIYLKLYIGANENFTAYKYIKFCWIKMSDHYKKWHMD